MRKKSLAFTGFFIFTHLHNLHFITARKRSLRRLCFYRCLSVHGGGGSPSWGGFSIPGGFSILGGGFSIRSMCGRYASYWNAFLLSKLLCTAVYFIFNKVLCKLRIAYLSFIPPTTPHSRVNSRILYTHAHNSPMIIAVVDSQCPTLQWSVRCNLKP